MYMFISEKSFPGSTLVFKGTVRTVLCAAASEDELSPPLGETGRPGYIRNAN